MKQLKITFLELAEKVVNQVKASKRRGRLFKPEGRLSKCGNYAVLKISKGKETLIDIDDFDRVACYRWKANKSSCRWYAKRNMRILGRKSKVLALARFILNASHDMCVDHVNGDSLDNRKQNLRLCNRSQNQWAVRRKCNKFSSKYRGVYWDKRENRWIAQLTFKWKRVFHKQFNDEKEAAIARDQKALEYHGKFAHLNFP